MSGADLFAGTAFSWTSDAKIAGGVWKRPLSEMPTSVPFSRGELTNLNGISFSVQPNPARDIIKIEIKNPEFSIINSQFSINIINELGISIYEKILMGSSIQIDTKSIPTGTFFCRIVSGNNTVTKKFVVVK